MGETGIFGQETAEGAGATIKPERNVLIAATGSVATIKLVQLISELSDEHIPYKFNVSVKYIRFHIVYFNNR